MQPIEQTILPRASAVEHMPERKGMEKFHAALNRIPETTKAVPETCPRSRTKLATDTAALATNGKPRLERVQTITASSAPPMPAMEEIASARPMAAAGTRLAAPISPK